ncbi:uncharacterized protein F5Z01DRAFT_682666 [Emericellopsis atlantica]|uniref:Rhodopsin domain-containing protein n=1 Tax=Emericellopsis atlantica TaxID=2614577 RepID=A0A9P7ZI87_9HYPO|nr:uncharacterized protein F5Z01DRAFT_682666 [Emericellopsis atlantica]KAG9252520.1 hypothetical protein F5Z01DRAFT_682666 [Emericellopsis atlantica]
MSGFPVTDGITTFLDPTGHDVDFENPQSQNKYDHFAITAVLGSLALFCLCQRLYTKQFILTGLQIDDASVVMQSVQIWSISIGGLCHHAWEMPIQVFEKHMLLLHCRPLFITCNGLSKASLLMFYLQISPQKYFRIAIWVAIGMVATYTIVIAGLLLFACRPIRAAWDPYLMADGDRLDTAALYIAIAIANIVSDVVLFIIPIPTLWGLKMPVAQKIGAAAMFGIGSITVATSIVRMVYLPLLLGATDIPWVAAPANVWSFVEVNLFIICGSMPTLRKFLKRFIPKLFDSLGSRPSQATPYLVSGSKLTRGHRTGYSQFGGYAMEDMPDGRGGFKENAGSATANVSQATGKNESTATVVGEDNVSEEAMLKG